MMACAPVIFAMASLPQPFYRQQLRPPQASVGPSNTGAKLRASNRLNARQLHLLVGRLGDSGADAGPSLPRMQIQ
jgi:hypothetical protein